MFGSPFGAEPDECFVPLSAVLLCSPIRITSGNAAIYYRRLRFFCSGMNVVWAVPVPTPKARDGGGEPKKLTVIGTMRLTHLSQTVYSRIVMAVFNLHRLGRIVTIVTISSVAGSSWQTRQDRHNLHRVVVADEAGALVVAGSSQSTTQTIGDLDYFDEKN